LEKNSIPSELVQSSELLAESAISMSVSVLAAENLSAREPSATDRERSIEFKSYTSKELKGAG